MFSQLWYKQGMKRIKEDIFLGFCGITAASRMFLSFLGQLQLKIFLELMLLLTVSGRGLCWSFILKFQFI